MSWKSNPKIRELGDYAKRHGYAMAILFAVHDDDTGQYTITTCGRDGKLCKAAGVAGELLHDVVQRSIWPAWPDREPPTTRQDDMADEIERLRGIVDEIIEADRVMVSVGSLSGAYRRHVQPAIRQAMQIREKGVAG